MEKGNPGETAPMTGSISTREKIILLALAVLLVAGVLWRAWPSAPVMELQGREQPGNGGAEEAVPELLIVHAVGAVKQPGVYELPVGSRVRDLVEAAGGFSAEADLERMINLARPLYDGEQVAFPVAGEKPESAAVPDQPGRVNINHATAEELTTLPGIGPARAAQIIRHREEHGFFTDIIEIMDVSGIGEGIFNQIKDQITVY